MEYLTLNELLVIHARLIQLVGGSPGVRDIGLLESALARPRATFDGIDLYASLWTKVAALFHSLIQNHPFIDGNKRTAVTATGIMLELNGYRLAASNDSVLAFAYRVIADQVALDEMAAWLEANSSKEKRTNV